MKRSTLLLVVGLGLGAVVLSNNNASARAPRRAPKAKPTAAQAAAKKQEQKVRRRSL